MSLVDELVEEHKQINNLLLEIDKSNDLNLIKNHVKKLKEVALVHLDKEDSLFYPNLMKSKHLEVNQIANTFSEIMNVYSKELMDVIEKVLESEDKLTEEVLQSYVHIRDRIKDRIIIEEQTLFPLYEKN